MHLCGHPAILHRVTIAEVRSEACNNLCCTTTSILHATLDIFRLLICHQTCFSLAEREFHLFLFFGDVLKKRLAGRWPWTTCEVQHAGMWMDPNDAGRKLERHTERRKRSTAQWPPDLFEHLGGSGRPWEPRAVKAGVQSLSLMCKIKKYDQSEKTQA